jgi:predicted  nucleic acid-binding Zn-ribbon protein
MSSSPVSSREKKLQRTVGILIFLIFLLIGLVALERLNPKFWSFGANQETFIKDAKDRLDSISNQLEVRMIQIKKLGGRVNELEAARQQILGDQKAISENPEMGQIEIQRKLAYYLRLIGQKDLEIKKLRKENFVLLARNDSLSREAKILQDGLSNVQKALRDSSLTFGVKQKELSERSRILEVRNQELSDKVNVAAALRAEGVNVYAISTRGKETGAQNQKAKKLEKIRVIFHLQENPLATKEIKTVYLRIIEPTGTTLSDYSLGSGTFPFKEKDLVYTAKQRIFYENNHQSVEFIYSRPNSYREGRHEIELYSEGFLIGLGSFEVR